MPGERGLGRPSLSAISDPTFPPIPLSRKGRAETKALEGREHNHAVLTSHFTLLVRCLVLGVDLSIVRDGRDEAHRLVRLLQS